jgi:hypothetical protein
MDYMYASFIPKRSKFYTTINGARTGLRAGLNMMPKPGANAQSIRTRKRKNTAQNNTTNTSLNLGYKRRTSTNGLNVECLPVGQRVIRETRGGCRESRNSLCCVTMVRRRSLVVQTRSRKLCSYEQACNVLKTVGSLN